jgi:proline iminopeptidase
MPKYLILILISYFLTTSIHAQDSHFIPIPDGVIHYRVFGKGKPIVIINGGPGMNSEGFSNFAQQLSGEGYLCIIFDQRGTGKSVINRVDTSSLNMANMVEDMEVLRRHLKIKQWTVFGQSFGGLLAAQYAYTYPKSIEKLVFSNSGGLNLEFLGYVGQRIEKNLSASERDSLQYYNRLLTNEPTNNYYLRRRAMHLSSAYLFQKEFIPTIAERLLQANLSINQLIYSDLQKHKFNYVGKFSGFKKPVLIFQGLNDIISIETAKLIHKSFSKSTLIELERCGHYPWLDRPDRFWKELTTFLKR